jgi:hypothetical protein
VFSNSVAGDSMFVSLATNNFHLTAGSPAIDAGATVSLATDYDGVPRPQGPDYDIGAYEYSASATQALAITTTSLPTGTVGTAYSTTLAAVNGTAPYTWTDPSCSGACNTGMTFTSAGALSGTPVNAGTSTFTFTVTDSAGHTASTQLPISITAAATPAVSLSPTGLIFASQTVATTSAAQTVTLTNTGAGALSISSIAASGPYTETNACPSSLPAGANCTISVTFTPTLAGTLVGALTFTDNAAASPQMIGLSGTGVTALAITTTSLPAGAVGTPYSTTLAAVNGTAPYTWTDSPCSGSCNTGMGFSAAGVLSGAPVNAGTSTFTMTVTDAAGHTASTQLSITIAAAATPAVSLSPTSLTFASQTVGTTSAAQTITLTNTGAGALSISGIAASGNFAETTACPSSLPAGASCTISVTFTPTAAGSPTGTISFTDNAAASQQAVSLSGTAVAATGSSSPSVQLSWTETTGTIAGYNVYRSTQSGTGYAVVNSSLVASGSYTDTTVSAGQTYYYVVTSVSNGVESAYSAQVTAVVPAS